MGITSQDLKKIGANYKVVAIRQLRKPLLEAFDVYKSNVAYGVEQETSTEHISIMQWYQDLLDKKPNALEDIPLKIQRYL